MKAVVIQLNFSLDTCRKVEHTSCDFSPEKKHLVIVSTNVIICNFAAAAAVTRKSS